jgi:hypothetical protein
LGFAAHVLADVKGVAFFFNYSDQQLPGHPARTP